MATTKTHTHSTPGPITATITTSATNITVIVEDRERAEYTVTTADDKGPSADVVNAARVDDNGIRLDESHGASTVIRTAGGGVSVTQVMDNVAAGSVVVGFQGNVIGGDNYGNIVSGRDTYINGTRVAGGIQLGGSRIILTARLPRGSSVTTKTASGDTTILGDAGTVRAETMSGDIRVGGVQDLHAKSMSGDIRVDRFSGSGSASSMSGDISVHAIAGGSLAASTMSGDVRLTGHPIQSSASSMSGRVRRS